MESGRLLVVGNVATEEIRTGNAKATGKPYTMHTLTILVGNSTVEASLPVEDGKAPVRLNFPRLSQVVLEVEEYPAVQVKDGKVFPGLRCRAIAVSALEKA